MMESLSPHDWQLISTALDDQLTDRERSELDALIQKNPAARVEMESLLRTRAVLRSAPRRRAPRNFTLSPAMLPKKSRFAGFHLVPALSLASVTSFVIFLAMLFSRPFALGAPAAAVPMLAAENAVEKSAAEATAPIIIYNTAPQAYGIGGYGGGGGGGGGGGIDTSIGTSGFTIITPEPTVVGEIQPTPEATLPARTEPTPSPTPYVTLPAPKLPTPEPTVESIPDASRNTQESVEGTGPILGIRPTEEMGVVSLDEPDKAAATPEDISGNLVNVLTWVFAAAGLASGVTAFVVWRKRL